MSISFGAQVVVYEDSGFLAEAVWRIYPLMDKIVFLVGTGPWNGGSPADPEYWKETIDKILNMPDPAKKFVIVNKWWATEAEQRNEGVKVLRELGCDWCMTVDDDELYNRQQLAHAKNVIRDVTSPTHISAWLVCHAIYWKQRDLVISKLTDAMPVFVHTRENDVVFTEARCFAARRGTWAAFPTSDIIMHHMSYVRDDAHMARKIASFSHAGQEGKDWYERVWKGWKPDSRDLHPNAAAPETFPQAVPVGSVSWPSLEEKPSLLMGTQMQSDYHNLQVEKYGSHESEMAHWSEGQRRYLTRTFAGTDLNAEILDAGCGDGVGIAQLKEMGFARLTGVDMSEKKLAKARAATPTAKFLLGDLHTDLDALPSAWFDVVMSSHALEHCHDPAVVVAQFKRLLRPGGKLLIVVPFPDQGPLDAHCGSLALSTRVADGGAGVLTWFTRQGFDAIQIDFDDFREQEIWLSLVARSSS